MHNRKTQKKCTHKICAAATQVVRLRIDVCNIAYYDRTTVLTIEPSVAEWSNKSYWWNLLDSSDEFFGILRLGSG